MSYHYAAGVEYRNAPAHKSVQTAFLLWFFLNAVSAHNWYMGRHKVAGAQMLLGLFGLILVPLQAGVALLLVNMVWVFADLFWVCRVDRAYR